jgi:Dyp-type peroxidase family
MMSVEESVQGTLVAAARAASAHLLTEADREDIQALVLFGTKSPYLRYHFFTVQAADKARSFVEFLCEPGPLGVNTAGAKQTRDDRKHLVYVGFTWKGLGAIGVDAVTLKSFPQAFRDGSRARAVTLGDVSDDEARTWTVSDENADIVVMLYARGQQELFDRSAALISEAGRRGCLLEKYLDAQALSDFNHASGQRVTGGVHFGFSDGIGQPAIAGERGQPDSGNPSVLPGTFVLGHAHPEHAETNQESLNPPELGTNGTFGAFRIFEQDCDAFEDFLDRNSSSPAERELVAARMCGRWRNGISLTVSPDDPFLVTPRAQGHLNDFDYVPTARHPLMPDDARGLRCPIGAHTRRANPRGSEVLGNMGQKIRVIRRGMPYGPPHVRGDGRKRGMLGLFLCGSLETQFEFIMRNWINDGLFARGLNPDETDPILRFVKTRGAAYLFFPSRTALGMLARAPEIKPRPEERPQPAAPGAPAGPPPTTDKLIEMIADGIKVRVGTGINRDAHPKHHGLVKAEFKVFGESDVAPEHRDSWRRLRHGIFGDEHSYTAYIRFSNGSPLRSTPDAAPDLRGMAIKLFGVDGAKLSPTEQATHDFILASDAQFFVKDLADYPKFLAAAGDAKLEQFPLLKVVFRSHENPLTIRYFSQTPYRCGPLSVKYSVLPENPPEQREPPPDALAGRGPDYLREAMAATLSEQDATMLLMVQVAPEDASLDDATELWTTPFTPVARITIPRQEFRSRPQMDMAENISMNPWHAIAAHEPLGSINLTRRTVYAAISALRHKNGGVPVIEPRGDEL